MTWRGIRGPIAVALVVLAALVLGRALSRLDGPGTGTPAPRAPAGAGGAVVSNRSHSPGAVPVPPGTDAASPGIHLVEVASGFDRPLFLTHAGDGSGRLFVVEQGGRIWVLRDGKRSDRPYLDARPLLDESSGERGLLGLAFAPDFSTSGRIYLSHTGPGPANVITRLRVDPAADAVTLDRAERVLALDDPAHNHNGGMIAFGPDGYLWIGTGDGGRAGDPWDHARDPGSRLGKMLRIDVASHPYRVPPDNPLLGRRGAAPEVWALGLRNPWRFSFDRETGELWIGDVGQGAWEEIDFEDPKAGGGRHYGWRTMEGRHCFDPRQGCDPEGLTPPIHEYGHDQGCSVTGGYVYRGRAIPALVGRYLFSDYCTGTVWALERGEGGEVRVQVLLESRRPVSSFGEGPDGEIYLCDHQGAVLRIEAVP
ncbi:MAG TPA: PQQ-dependent sugar dehydrogenase [Candidatus Limnocylindrales bacterium]|nr:PQQ-dependent sugar dehydrogenase [Candidatus Limnocylindrales bacterium]